MIISAPMPPQEGIGNYVYNLSKNLLERGHQITIITRGSMHVNTGSINGITIIRVPFIPLYPLHISIHGLFVDKVFNSIEKNYDIVHIHAPLTPIVKTSLPIVSTIHGSMVENSKALEVIDINSAASRILSSFVSYPLVLKLIEKSSLVTTVSNSVASELKKYYGLDNAVVVGNGVNEKDFLPRRVKDQENYILYVGRLSYGKGLFDLLDAIKLICENYDTKFMIVGEGNIAGKLKKKVKKEKLNNNVLFKGYIGGEDLIRLYQNATMFVLPSHYEGLPTVLLEAMSCALPSIAASVSGCVDVIQNGENGLLVPPRSPIKLAESVNMLLEDSLLREKLGNNARKTIEERFTWNFVANQMEKCYESLI